MSLKLQPSIFIFKKKDRLIIEEEERKVKKRRRGSWIMKLYWQEVGDAFHVFKTVCHKFCFTFTSPSLIFTMKRQFLKRGISLNHVTFNASSIKVVLFLIRFRSQRVFSKVYPSVSAVPLNDLKQKQEKSERKKTEKRESKVRQKGCGVCRPERNVGGCTETENKSP